MSREEEISSPLIVIRKECKIGPFQLGMPLYRILKMLAKPSATTLADVHISYNEDDPMTGEVVVKILSHSLTLVFDAKRQILIRTEIENVRIETKSAQKTLDEFKAFTSSNTISDQNTYSDLSRLFKSFLSREVDNNKNTELYDEPTKPQSGELCNGTFIFKFSGVGNDANEKKNLRLTKVVNSLNDTCQELKVVKVSDTGVFCIDDFVFKHGSHTQEVVADLKDREGSKSDETCTYYNYFSRGFDFVFGKNDNLVKRFVLHTNSPSDSVFGIYSKCFFELKIAGAVVTQDSKWPKLNLQFSNKTPLGDGVVLYQVGNCLFEVEDKTGTIFTIFI
ncbi:hypothetical protein EIN_405310 [Entamoeba invadens IP1]|uniref:Uncharacterized protein n=2 Tax=Entamoeba invadens TaxID=33085 RepID=A0A0A1U6U2_ENTIV|nr:hypothetical protein EIN_405310 [Entamoeba invadens IP1]ELP90117.1 hypothetical protein EIN_405310 [Entamoeba invadens IP1]BAN41858.1 hypothetical protein [Entamoeba invadens]|eukprot:XP_004256888.1 hypothetical protein EIN_405310 [Entamoeba invadens IP1]